MRKLFVIAVVAAVIGIAVSGVRMWLDRAIDSRGPHEQNVRLTVRSGESLRAVLGDLQAQGALRDARAVALYLRSHGRQITVKAGDYDIAAHATPREILEQLEAGRVVLLSVTIVEGWTFADMRRTLEAAKGVRNTLAGRPDAEVMKAIGREGEHPEGRFFPDTYRFSSGTTDVELYSLAYREMADALADAWQKRRDGLPLKSPYEALTLASVVEKETGRADERPQIAGVFVARLRQGMRLQSDPTVIYGLGKRYDGDIRTRDLREDTPYNTYTRGGLPPTPIALPSRGALLAVAQPKESGALFFVATGNGDGSHYFSSTLEEHNAAVQRFLERLKAGDRD